MALAAAVLLAMSREARFVVRAGWEEGRILLRRQPLTKLVADTTVSPARRAAFRLVLDARAYGRDSLGLKPDGTFTTFADVRRDTLLLLLTAAHRNSLTPYTWWFPIVGRVPYKGYFDPSRAEADATRLVQRGYDVYVRPAAAFSTLGWFEDPLLSTALSDDPTIVVETVLHEIAHNTLYVPGHTTFDESFAMFVGFRGAAAFFSSRGDTAMAHRAAALWRDQLRLGQFYAELADELRALYRSNLPIEVTLDRRAEIFARARDRLRGPLAHALEVYSGVRLAMQPLNNASVLAAIVYRTRLGAFDTLFKQEGRDVRRTVAALAAALDAGGRSEPFLVLDSLVGEARQ